MLALAVEISFLGFNLTGKVWHFTKGADQSLIEVINNKF